MKTTIPSEAARPRHLTAVPAIAGELKTLADSARQLDRGLAEVHRLAIDYLLSRSRPAPRLSPAAELCLGSAEAFLYSLDSEDLTAEDGRRAARLLGLAESHLVSVISILRAVTS